jgi:small subunit ribosomal protein S20
MARLEYSRTDQEDELANTASAKKRMRQNARRRTRNRAVITRARSYLKRARQAVDTREEDAAASVRQAVSELDRAAAKGVIHRNNAGRRKRRLMKRLRAAQD